MSNLSTLICSLKDGSIRYTFYGGTGSSGTPYALSNIQYYDLINGKISWNRNKSLPIDTRLGETLEEFKERILVYGILFLLDIFYMQ